QVIDVQRAARRQSRGVSRAGGDVEGIVGGRARGGLQIDLEPAPPQRHGAVYRSIFVHDASVDERQPLQLEQLRQLLLCIGLVCPTKSDQAIGRLDPAPPRRLR